MTLKVSFENSIEFEWISLIETSRSHMQMKWCISVSGNKAKRLNGTTGERRLPVDGNEWLGSVFRWSRNDLDRRGETGGWKPLISAHFQLLKRNILENVSTFADGISLEGGGDGCHGNGCHLPDRNKPLTWRMGGSGTRFRQQQQNCFHFFFQVFRHSMNDTLHLFIVAKSSSPTGGTWCIF